MLCAAQERAFQAAQPPLRVSGRPARDEQGQAFQSCPICGVQATDPETGAPQLRQERRWHCSQHASLAGPRDLEEFRWIKRFAPSGVFEALNPIDEELREERERMREQET